MIEITSILFRSITNLIFYYASLNHVNHVNRYKKYYIAKSIVLYIQMICPPVIWALCALRIRFLLDK
jgi:hypothetical protein